MSEDVSTAKLYLLWTLKFEWYVIFICHDFFKFKKNMKKNLNSDYKMRQVRFGFATPCPWDLFPFTCFLMCMIPEILLHPCNSSCFQSPAVCLLLLSEHQLRHTSLAVPEPTQQYSSPSSTVALLSSWGQAPAGCCARLRVLGHSSVGASAKLLGN